MSETLTIKNFGPIKDMSFEFKKINIFIGDQSTGKSTEAKILSLVKELFDLVLEDESKQIYRFKENAFEEQLKIHGLTNYLNSNSFIEFDDSTNYLKYEGEKIFITKGEKEKEQKTTRVRAFIPSYRKAAILLKNSINALAGLKVPITEMFFFFGQQLINAKLAKDLYDYTKILGIKYKYVNDSDIVILENGKEIKIEDAASAISSGVPMLLVFDHSVQSMYPTRHRIYHYANRPFIIIEEPELNCFPTTQKKIVEHFMSKIKFETEDGIDYYCGLVITTHSPYILTTLNNMMYAYTVAQKEPLEVNEIVDKKYWINPNDVSAYMLLPNGKCENIIDSEGLIKAEKIDSVSSMLNKDFNSLMDIELKVHG